MSTFTKDQLYAMVTDTRKMESECDDGDCNGVMLRLPDVVTHVKALASEVERLAVHEQAFEVMAENLNRLEVPVTAEQLARQQIGK